MNAKKCKRLRKLAREDVYQGPSRYKMNTQTGQIRLYDGIRFVYHTLKKLEEENGRNR